MKRMRLHKLISLLTVFSLFSVFPLACALACENPASAVEITSHCHGNSAEAPVETDGLGFHQSKASCPMLSALENKFAAIQAPASSVTKKANSLFATILPFETQVLADVALRIAPWSNPPMLWRPQLPLYLKNPVLRL